MLFFVSKADMRNFGNDNIKRCCRKLLGDTLPNLKYDLEYISKKVQIKFIKTRSRNFQLTILGCKQILKYSNFVDGNKIVKSHEVVLLDLTTDDKVNF